MNDRRTRRLIWMIAGIAVFFLAAAVVAWLWNSIIPWVIGFPPVTYWQAAGLLLLTRLFFGGLGRIFAQDNAGCRCREMMAEPERVPVDIENMDPGQKSEYLMRRRAFLREVDDK